MRDPKYIREVTLKNGRLGGSVGGVYVADLMQGWDEIGEILSGSDARNRLDDFFRNEIGKRFSGPEAQEHIDSYRREVKAVKAGLKQAESCERGAEKTNETRRERARWLNELVADEYRQYKDRHPDCTASDAARAIHKNHPETFVSFEAVRQRIKRLGL
ncbi:MAG: hypothetical protein U9R74_04535 [Pseudomonadota bacterium]|nr:hypothetical protein [Pseudomonadota bacterium]